MMLHEQVSAVHKTIGRPQKTGKQDWGRQEQRCDGEDRWASGQGGEEPSIIKEEEEQDLKYKKKIKLKGE